MNAAVLAGDALIRAQVRRLLNLHEGPLALPDIVQLGDSAVAALEAVLRGPSQSLHHSRAWAADALAAIGSAAATGALVRALRDCAGREPPSASREAEDVVVSTIADHLGALSDPQALGALLEALRSRPYPGCVRALARLGDPRAVPLLVQSLFDDATRGAALGALRQLGAVAIPALVAALGQPQRVNGAEPPSRIDGRAAAATLIGTLLPRAVGILAAAERTAARRALAAALHDPSDPVRLAAALSLSRCSEGRALRAVRTLIGALGDADWRGATNIMHALTRLGPRIEVPLLEAIASGTRTPTAARRRRRAIWVAGKLGTPAAIAALLSRTASDDLLERLAAVTALACIAGGDSAPLYRYLEDPQPAVRRRALEGLCRRRALSTECAVRLLGDADREIRQRAAASLCQRRAAALAVLSRALRPAAMPLQGWRSRLRLSWYALRWIIGSRGGRRLSTLH